MFQNEIAVFGMLEIVDFTLLQGEGQCFEMCTLLLCNFLV